jgi:hypothetical protein
MAAETIVDLLAKDGGSILQTALPTESPLPLGAAELVAAVRLASLRVYLWSTNSRRHRGMSATLVAMRQLDDGRMCFAHAGDSRAYRIRNGTAEQLTDDDTARGGGIARGMGLARRTSLKVRIEPVARGDVFVLCSDGLHGQLTPEEIATAIQAAPAHQPEDRARALVAAARERGGSGGDNVTVVVSSAAEASGRETNTRTLALDVTDTEGPLPRRRRALARRYRLPAPSWLLPTIGAGIAAIVIALALGWLLRKPPVRYGRLELHLDPPELAADTGLRVMGGARPLRLARSATPGIVVVDSLRLDAEHELCLYVPGYEVFPLGKYLLADSVWVESAALTPSVRVEVTVTSQERDGITRVAILGSGRTTINASFLKPRQRFEARVPPGRYALRITMLNGRTFSRDTLLDANTSLKVCPDEGFMSSQ